MALSTNGVRITVVATGQPESTTTLAMLTMAIAPLIAFKPTSFVGGRDDRVRVKPVRNRAVGVAI